MMFKPKQKLSVGHETMENKVRDRDKEKQDLGYEIMRAD